MLIPVSPCLNEPAGMRDSEQKTTKETKLIRVFDGYPKMLWPTGMAWGIEQKITKAAKVAETGAAHAAAP